MLICKGGDLLFYLFLAILCSSAIALIFKYSETNGMNRYAVTTSNYFMATIVSVIIVIKEGILKIEHELALETFNSEFTEVVVSNIKIFSRNSSLIWGIVIGVFAGVFFFLAFIYYQKSVKENGVGLSGTFSKLGILIPMILSIILWKEIPTVLQWFGIILSIISIVLVNFTPKKDFSNNIKFSLVLLFVFGGLAEFSNKIFQKYAMVEYKSVFLFFVFFTAFLISLFFTLKKKGNVNRKDIFTGFMVGIPNLFSSFFLIMALNYLKTSVAFPLYSAGTIVIISLGGVLFFREKLNRSEILSIVMTIVALILINV